MRTRFGMATLVILVCLVLPLSSASGQGKLSFSIVTGGTGGVWYPLGGAIGGVISKNVPNTDATAEVTTAAIDNLKLLCAGKAGLAFAYDYHAVWANEGKIDALSKKQPVRIALGFYEQPLHIVTKEGTGVKSVLELKGKRVSTGAPNSGTEEQADYVLKALGIDWNKDFKREKLGAGESVAALKDGKIDALFWSGAVPTSSIIDLATTPGLKMVILPLGGEIADRIMKGNPGVFHQTVFAKGSYSSVRERCPCPGHHRGAQCHGEFSPGQGVPDRQRHFRQYKGALRRVEGGPDADTGTIREADHARCDSVSASGGSEVLQGEGRAEIDAARNRRDSYRLPSRLRTVPACSDGTCEYGA